MFGFMLAVIFMFMLLISMLVYITIKTNSILKRKNKKIRLIALLIIFILLFIGLKIDMVNATIVDVHAFVFILFAELITLILKKRRITIKPYVSIIIGIILCTAYLSYAYHEAHHVVQTNYRVYTNKKINKNIRIAQISDSHVGATMNGDDFIKYMDSINKTNPDLVVVTGDFVDDDTSLDDMKKSCKGLGNLKTKYGVYFIYGNHDKGYYNYRGYKDDDLRKELAKNNVIILEDAIAQITDDIILVGRQDAQVMDRKTSLELTKDIDKDKYIIMLDHEPNDFKNEEKSKVDLVLAGHTHGGQLFPLGPIGKLMKFNDSIYGLSKINDTTFIVNSGLGDWAIKFKSDAISEYVIIDIIKE